MKPKTIKEAISIHNKLNHDFIKIANNLPDLNYKKNDIIKVIDFGKEYILTDDYIRLYNKENYKSLTF